MSNPQYGEPEFLCYQVIRKVKEWFGEDEDLPKTTFYKLCYITDRELREQDVDVELPVHWYRYGGVLTADAMQGGFYELVEKAWEENRGYNVVLKGGINEDDFLVEEKIEADIEQTAEDVVKEFGGHYGISVSQDYQYQEYAPNDFVRTLHTFRGFVQDLDAEDSLSADEYVGGVSVSYEDVVSGEGDSEGESPSPDEETNQQIRAYLDELIVTYPDGKYSRMEDQFLDWENLSWQLTKNGFYSQLQNFMKDFWTAFSRVELRVQHNRNVPLKIRSRWRNRIPEEMEKFELKVEEYRDVVLKNREDTDVLGMIEESYSETVRNMFNQPMQNE